MLNVPLDIALRTVISLYTVHLVTDDPGSNPDKKYARRRDRQNYASVE